MFFKGKADFYSAINNSPVGNVPLMVYLDNNSIAIALDQDMVFYIKDREMLREFVDILTQFARNTPMEDSGKVAKEFTF